SMYSIITLPRRFVIRWWRASRLFARMAGTENGSEFELQGSRPGIRPAQGFGERPNRWCAGQGVRTAFPPIPAYSHWIVVHDKENTLCKLLITSNLWIWCFLARVPVRGPFQTIATCALVSLVFYIALGNPSGLPTLAPSYRPAQCAGFLVAGA